MDLGHFLRGHVPGRVLLLLEPCRSNSELVSLTEQFLDVQHVQLRHHPQRVPLSLADHFRKQFSDPLILCNRLSRSAPAARAQQRSLENYPLYGSFIRGLRYPPEPQHWTHCQQLHLHQGQHQLFPLSEPARKEMGRNATHPPPQKHEASNKQALKVLEINILLHCLSCLLRKGGHFLNSGQPNRDVFSLQRAGRPSIVNYLCVPTAFSGYFQPGSPD